MMNTGAVKKKLQIGEYLRQAFFLLLLAVDIYPVIWVVFSSLKSANEFVTRPMYALPTGLNLENYVQAIKLTNFGVLFTNTVIVTVFSVAIAIVLSAMASFALSVMRWRMAGVVSTFLRLGMFVPGFVLLLPQFLMFQRGGLLNTRVGLIILFSCGLSMPIYLLNGFYRYLPQEVLEASVVDGCGVYRMFIRVVVPMMLNGYVTVIMLIFFGIWNDLIISRTFVSKSNLKMLQAGLAAFSDERGGRDWGATFAAIVLAVAPTTILYLVLNKKIIEGLTAGAVKG